jgi:hypothetical protein
LTADACDPKLTERQSSVAVNPRLDRMRSYIGHRCMKNSVCCELKCSINVVLISPCILDKIGNCILHSHTSNGVCAYLSPVLIGLCCEADFLEPKYMEVRKERSKLQFSTIPNFDVHLFLLWTVVLDFNLETKMEISSQ